MNVTYVCGQDHFDKVEESVSGSDGMEYENGELVIDPTQPCPICEAKYGNAFFYADNQKEKDMTKCCAMTTTGSNKGGLCRNKGTVPFHVYERAGVIYALDALPGRYEGGEWNKRENYIFCGQHANMLREGKSLLVIDRNKERGDMIKPINSGPVCGQCSHWEDGEFIQVRHATIAEVRECFGVEDIVLSSPKKNYEFFPRDQQAEAIAFAKKTGRIFKSTKDRKGWVVIRPVIRNK